MEYISTLKLNRKDDDLSYCTDFSYNNGILKFYDKHMSVKTMDYVILKQGKQLIPLMVKRIGD